MGTILGLDIGSNSVGSAWINRKTGHVASATSIFPAGVDESDDKRGDPKNAKRRMTRRTRITLARRSDRKRKLRLKLIASGLLPQNSAEFKNLLESTDPWDLRRKGLDDPLSPFEFGRVLLHLAQRRGALGLRIADESEDNGGANQPEREDGKVKAAIRDVQQKMSERGARTFGEFIAMIRVERVTPITSVDQRPSNKRKGPREFRGAVRNKAASYEHCADRAMIRHEFLSLWKKQKGLGGTTSTLLTDDLRRVLDDETGDDNWRHKGLLFGQRRQSWDLGTLGRCVLEPTERCAPHADMYASCYLVVETVNNLRIIERGQEARALTRQERQKIKAYLSGPLGLFTPPKRKGKAQADRPKTSVNVADLRNVMGTAADGWGRVSKTSRFYFNIESDTDRVINTDWFSREIVHGAVTVQKWNVLPNRIREGLNRAILKYDPEQDGDDAKLKKGVMAWASLTETEADALLSAWKKRPKIDAKRLNMSRKALQNLLTVMDRDEPWPDDKHPGQFRWLTQIEARKLIANDNGFLDVTTKEPMDVHARRRYATGTKGATARDRHYMRKHLLKKGEDLIFGPDGLPLAEPPPAPLISNPVVRKAIHEVRRHLIEYMKTFGCKPDEVHVELAREAKMGKLDADRLLFRNRLRNRIRNDIINDFKLGERSATQQRAATDRVILCVQQGGVCPLCGSAGLSPRQAANGEGCEVAHIIPRASGGHNGLSNIVLAHTKCNREMGRRTPRQFWSSDDGFEKGMTWVEGIFGNVDRPNPSEVKNATGNSLWSCYFTRRDDDTKIAQFKKDIKDIQEMTLGQEASTKYAARQVMAYIADALYGGKGLPERSTGTAREDDQRKIFTTDGIWTSRLRREWGLFFDPHDARSKGLADEQQHERKEKNRGDHRHHAVDAVVIALCSDSVRRAWEDRERKADRDGINTADGEAMENYRRNNPLPPPEPYKTREDFREAVRRTVFGEGEIEKPISHRPVKRKLIGALHEETLLGPVVDKAGSITENFTGKKSVLALDPNHLRMPRPETKKEAVERLAARRLLHGSADERAARKWARAVVASKGYAPAAIDPSPGKSGIVRDVALRTRIRQCLTDAGLDPDNFSANHIKKLVESCGLKQASGVPIKSVVLLRTMSDPVITSRKRQDYLTGHTLKDDNPASMRAYVGGNNHHIEIREDAKGNWTGEIVTTFEAAQRKLARLQNMHKAGIPSQRELRRLSDEERRRFSSRIREIENACPLVDRRDDDSKGGRFIMSLCEGETLFMKHKATGQVSYFIVAKLDKPRSIVVVPHWDARAATERKDSNGNKIPDSKREQFPVAPGDLKSLAPPGHAHAAKVRVSPLGKVQILEKD